MSFSTVTVLNFNESDSLGLASRVDQGPSKVSVATFTGPTWWKKVPVVEGPGVSEFCSSHHSDVTFYVGPVALSFGHCFKLCFQDGLLNLLWIPRNMTSGFRPLPTWSIFLASNFTVGMFFLSSFHFQCFCWIFAFHTCNLLHDLEAGWITSNDFEVCINFNFYCPGYCHCQLFVIRCVFHLRYKKY